MLNHQHGNAGGTYRANEIKHRCDLSWVQSSHNFIEKEETRLCRESAGNLKTLTASKREATASAVPLPREPSDLQRPEDERLRILAVMAAQKGGCFYVFRDTEFLERANELECARDPEPSGQVRRAPPRQSPAGET